MLQTDFYISAVNCCKAKKQEMHTYFIRCGRRVKIGRSADVLKRFAALQTASPQKMKLLLVVAGDREKELHERFVRHRLHGEWFRLSEEILQFIHVEPGVDVSQKKDMQEVNEGWSGRRGPNLIRWVSARGARA